MATHPDVVAEVGAAIGEDMKVVESASEEVQRTRARCRTLEGRLRALLKPLPGEVSEQVCVPCVLHALPDHVVHCMRCRTGWGAACARCSSRCRASCRADLRFVCSA